MEDVIDVDDRCIKGPTDDSLPTYADCRGIRAAANTDLSAANTRTGRPRADSNVLDATPEVVDHIVIGEQLRKVVPTERYYSTSRFRGLAIADADSYRSLRKLDLSYSASLCRLLHIIYGCGGVVYGGAVRDLLRGIAPGDIDIHMRPGGLVRLFRGLRESFVYSISRRKPSGAYVGERYTVIVEPSHIYTDAAMFVLDITSGVGELFDLPVDYNVNMLYIDAIIGDYAVGPYYVDGNTIRSEWCTAKTRGECQLEGIVASLHSGIARIDHDCGTTASASEVVSVVPNNKRHIYCTMVNRFRREKSLGDSGFTDGTTYKCTNIACRLASVKRVVSHALQSAKYDCETNTGLYLQAMGNDTHLRKAIGAQIRSIIEKISEPSDRTLRERVLAVADFGKTADSLMPKTPAVVRIRATTIEDCVDLRRAVDDGAIDDYNTIVTAARGYITMVQRIISESLDANTGKA